MHSPKMRRNDAFADALKEEPPRNRRNHTEFFDVSDAQVPDYQLPEGGWDASAPGKPTHRSSLLHHDPLKRIAKGRSFS